MTTDLNQDFEAFELFARERLMRGFLRVGRLVLLDADQIRTGKQFGFEQPFDVRFGKMMVKAMAHLLGVFGSVLFGVADNFEISVVLAGDDPDESESLLARELMSRLAGEASSKLATMLGCPVVFQSRLYEFPSAELVRRYFVWRRDDNQMQVLDRYVEYVLAGAGSEGEQISELLSSFGREEKLEILTQNELVFSDVPGWQRNGVAAFWQAGVDDSAPSLLVDTDLPDGDGFVEYLSQRI